MYEGALCAVKAGEEALPVTEVKALKAKIRELEHLLGRKTMEVEILKEAIAIAREKTGNPSTHFVYEYYIPKNPLGKKSGGEYGKEYQVPQDR